ncbi:MAG TPA: hypothetical protein PKC24_16395, partial [Cyclobacteriaceae bacterium]|nr:hypothetical protein [Cyclobacteriaceae bacterium]
PSLIASNNNNIENEDYIRVQYSLNGAAPVTFDQNGFLTGNTAGADFPPTLVSHSVPLVGATLRIIVTINNNGGDDEIYFTNVFVREASSPDLPVITNINDPNSAVSNLQPGPNVFTWEIRSEFGVCPASTNSLTITRNPLPVANNLNEDVCENNFGDAEATVDLTVYNDVVTGILGSVDRTVEWYTNALRTPPFLVLGPVNVNTGSVFYHRVINTSAVLPQCQNEGQIEFTVLTLPEAVDPNIEFCEDFPVGLGQKNNVDLTVYNSQVIGTANPAERSVLWLQSDASTPVPTPTDVDNIVDGSTFFAQVTNTITNCINLVEVEVRVYPRPVNNPVIAPDGSTPASITLCRSTATLLFQIDPDRTPNTTYEWDIPTGAGEFVLFGGGGVNDFFALLRFPNIVVSPGLTLRVR